MNLETIRLTVDLTGVVQGVGFRPTVKRLADQNGLGGWVQNRSGTVRLAVEGQSSEVERFVYRLASELPKVARVDHIHQVGREHIQTSGVFHIMPSHEDQQVRSVIPADLKACSNCLAEVLDPLNRRYLYPFTTCTNCGPRYTVVKAMPYDRERTSLESFPLCTQCRAEYYDPTDRRFHAESIACPECGPRLFLTDPKGNPLPGDPLRECRAALAKGAIVALRGIGGYQLMVNAMDKAAISRLRAKKHRPHKPLAVMVRDVEVLRRFCVVSEQAEVLMSSPCAPIVVCDLLSSLQKENFSATTITPDTRPWGPC